MLNVQDDKLILSILMRIYKILLKWPLILYNIFIGKFIYI